MKLALAIHTDGEVSTFSLPDDELAALQGIVGGWVQCIDLEPTISMWLNDEGKLIGLPHNPVAQELWDRRFGPGTDMIVGNVVITGGTDENGDTVGLHEDTCRWLLHSLREVFAYAGMSAEAIWDELNITTD